MNVDQANIVRTDVLKSMVGRDVQEYTFRNSNQAVSLGVKSSIKINGVSARVDPQLLFLRLVTVGDCISDLSTLSI